MKIGYQNSKNLIVLDHLMKLKSIKITIISFFMIAMKISFIMTNKILFRILNYYKILVYIYHGKKKLIKFLIF